MVDQPKLNLGHSRLKDLSSGEYRVHTTRISQEERIQLKETVKEEGYVNMEDLLEDAVYHFYMEKPYIRGYYFFIPCSSIASVRKTNEARHTGWRQLNVFLKKELSEAIAQEVHKLSSARESISFSSYVYTAIRWFLAGSHEYKLKTGNTPQIATVDPIGKAKNTKSKTAHKAKKVKK